MSASHPLDPVLSSAFHESDSGVIWEAGVGQVTNAGTFTVCLLFSWLLLPALIALWRYFVTASHTFSLTTQVLQETFGVFTRHTETLELYRVKDITVTRPFLQSLFGRGRIVLITSDRSTPKVILDAIPDPLGVAILIRECVERCRVAKGVRELD
jgi:uncharacterized membrane protein YdbT with pleckstrin-like domain